MVILLMAFAVAGVAFCTGVLASSSASAASSKAPGQAGRGPSSAYRPVEVNISRQLLDDRVEMAYARWGRKLRLTADIEEVVGCEGEPVESLRTTFAMPLSQVGGQVGGDVIEGSCAEMPLPGGHAAVSLLV
ncbi:MAG TPA: hypothetical protein VGF95_06230 [Solirubrobacteraceae bacterium]|jgi:hypothetical protein